MNHGGRVLVLVLALLGADAPAADGAMQTRPARNLVTCRDGTFSKGGSGACRQHGGLRRDAERRPPAPESVAPVGDGKGQP